SAGAVDPDCLRRVASARTAIYEPRTAGPHPAGDGARSRGLRTPGESQRRQLAEWRALLRRCSAVDAPDSGRLRALAALQEARRDLRRISLNEAVAVFRDQRTDIVAS